MSVFFIRDGIHQNCTGQVRLSVCLSVCLSVRLSVRPSVCLSVHVFVKCNGARVTSIFQKANTAKYSFQIEEFYKARNLLTVSALITLQHVSPPTPRVRVWKSISACVRVCSLPNIMFGIKVNKSDRGKN